MSFVQIGNRFINIGIVAWADALEEDGAIELHFAVPQAGWTSLYATGTGVLNPPSVTLRLEGQEAVDALRQLRALLPSS